MTGPHQSEATLSEALDRLRRVRINNATPFACAGTADEALHLAEQASAILDVLTVGDRDRLEDQIEKRALDGARTILDLLCLNLLHIAG